MSQHGCPERLSNRSKGFQEDGSGQATMEVLVETLTGTAFEMTVSPSDTIFAIKSKIFRVEGIPVSQQHLVYNLRELEDSLSLREHAIGDGARLRLVVGLRGGPVATRRLPPPEPWRDIERLLHSNRDDAEWTGGGGGGSGGGGGGGGSGCKVTVLVFREGERVNMVRVRENRDGSYSPLDHAKCGSESPSLSQLLGGGEGGAGGEGGGALQENAVTMGKMMELRRRMDRLAVRRRGDRPDAADIQKTRSEETLCAPSLLEAGAGCGEGAGGGDTERRWRDGRYTRYEYDCALDRYTLLPPDCDQQLHDDDRLKLSDALAGSILVKAREGLDDAAILEECLDPDNNTIPAAEYGPLVGGEGGGWRARGSPFPSTSGALGAHAHARSASALHVRAARPAPRAPPLAEALFSSSTSDLEKLKRNSRILPALSRHRNREHLHLSDEGLDLPPATPPPPPTPPTPLAPGSERRQRRIEKIAELDAARRHLARRADNDNDNDNAGNDKRDDKPTPTPPHAPDTTTTQPDKVEKKVRLRCAFCKKRLSVATVHSCRCGAVLCAPHRYAEVHGCAYDYKAAAQRALRRDNPRVSADKLPKI